MYTRLFDYVDKNQYIMPFQHGFKPDHSTVMSLLNLQDNKSAAIDRNEYSLGIFIDIAKAFDTVNQLLLKKLENLGARGIALTWFQSYLANRYQYVYCNGSSSSLKLIKYGVLQVSILGPLLFLLFTHDFEFVAFFFIWG